MTEVRIPVRVPPEVKEGWIQLVAYVPDDAGTPLDSLAIVLVSHIPTPAEEDPCS